MSQSIAELFEAPCSSLCRPDANIVTINAKEDPLTAFKKLIDGKILSAPCLASSKFCGFLEVRDLVTFICFASEQAKEMQKPKPSSNLDTICRHMNHPTMVSRVAAAKLHNKPIKGITCEYLARRHKFVTCAPGDPISKIVALLCTAGCRRVPILAEDGSILDIISQSTVVSFIARNKDNFGDVLSGSKIGDLGTSPVISIGKAASALETFSMMGRHNLHGLAVVDENGKVCGNTSSSDLKLYINGPGLDLATVTIWEFLQRIRAQDMGINNLVITLPEQATLLQAIEMLTAKKKHRLFVVDSEYRPTRAVALTDVLKRVVAATAAGS